MKTSMKYELGLHKGKNVIYIRFDYDPQLIKNIKKLVGIQWSKSQKAWYVTDNQYYREKIGLPPKPNGKDELTHIQPVNQPAFHAYIETMQ